jgi:hypothetical protein
VFQLLTSALIEKALNRKDRQGKACEVRKEEKVFPLRPWRLCFAYLVVKGF